MEPFKNLINADLALEIAQLIARYHKNFKQDAFLKNMKLELKPLELKDRVRFMAKRLHETLPDDPKISLPILKKIIKKNEADQIGLSGFSLWPVSEYISIYGLSEFDLSMDVLKELTKAFTAEFAVRAFFLHDEARTLEFFHRWVKDENEHVRRLVSEGSRPLLPWGQKLPSFVKNPEATWELLEILKHDSSIYVRKSVANHLNDHSKNHPNFLIQKLLKWKKMHPKDKDIDWIIRHASRTLIKKGHTKAFLIFGIKPGNVKVVSQKVLTKNVELGKSLEVEIELKNLTSKNIKAILDHEVHLLRQNGKHNIKCFKGKSVELLAGKKMKLSFKIPLKVVTTRTYYPGEHFWNIKVNGQSEKKISFKLRVKNS